MPTLYLINCNPFFVVNAIRLDEVPPMKYAQPLTTEERDLLDHTMRSDASSRARTRAHKRLACGGNAWESLSNRSESQRPLSAARTRRQGQTYLYYFDEAGLSLNPTVPYAWQPSRGIIEIPASKYGRVNVLGFMNRQNDLHPYLFEQSVHTGVVIACFDDFCQTITKKTVVAVDNASVHWSDEFEDRIPYWKKQGLTIKYLSSYSPELNIIEILWRRIKYTWLPFSAYDGLNALIGALEKVLCDVGSEYQITFA